MAYSTATLTGKYETFDGQPASGVVEIIPNSRQLVDPEGDVILSGRVKVTLDETGAFSVTLPATDDATVEPATGRQYTVVAKLRHTHLAAVTGVELATGATVDVADLASAPVVDPFVSTAATTAQLDALEASLSPVATSGAYSDLTGAPTIPATAADVGAEPAGTAAALDASLAPVAKSGSYTDLTGKPTIPTTAADVNALPDTTTAADIGAQPAATLDADTAARVNDTASQTRAALSATYAPRLDPTAAESFAPLLGKLRGGQDTTWLNFGDSLSVETWDWPYEVTRRISTLFPSHAARVAPHDGTAWQSPTVITSGGGATSQFTMANAAVAGHSSADWLASLSTVTPTYSPDVITIALGHNDDPVTDQGNYEALVDAVIAAYPNVPVVLMVQNPNQYNNDQTVRRAYITRKAAAEGIAATDAVWWALGGPAPLSALYNPGDAVHLALTGIAVWKNAVLEILGLTTDEAVPANVIDIATRTTGDVFVSSSSFVAVDTGLDLTIPAVAGDVLDVSLAAIVSGRNTGSFDNNLNFTARTRLAGADVNNIGGPGSVPGWFAPDRLVTIAGRQFYTVQAGDLDTSGNVTLRLYVKTDDTTSGRTIFANTGNPMQFAARNLGA